MQSSHFPPAVSYNSITYNGANNTFVFVTPLQTASKCRSNFAYSSKILRFTQMYLHQEKKKSHKREQMKLSWSNICPND